MTMASAKKNLIVLCFLLIISSLAAEFQARFKRSPWKNDRDKETFRPYYCNREPCHRGGSRDTFPPAIPRERNQFGNSRFRRAAESGEFSLRRAAEPGEFSQDSNTRGSIYSTKSFGPNSHGGWQSTAKIEHDIWKSKDGNTRVTAFGQHDRIDGGRFNGFKENKFGAGLEHRFRRAAEPGEFSQDSNTRGSIYSTKSFGLNSHGGWQSTAKIEHDVWKSQDGNTRVTAFGQHDRIDGGQFNGFKENKFGAGLEHRFRRAADPGEFLQDPSE